MKLVIVKDYDEMSLKASEIIVASFFSFNKSTIISLAFKLISS